MITAKCVKLNNSGWDSYKELEFGKTYEVEYADVGGYYTDVYLKGFKKGFNSVCFKFYKDGKEINIVSEFM
jgi:hypothetical protein